MKITKFLEFLAMACIYGIAVAMLVEIIVLSLVFLDWV